MTILLVDDHAIVLEGIMSLLTKAVGSATVLTVLGASQAEAALKGGNVDVMVTDLDLKDESGLMLIRRAHELSPSTKVVVYTMHEEPWTISEIADSNPDGAVMKSDAPQELACAIKAVANGKDYFSTTFSRLLALLGRHPERLSERERQVLKLTADGLSTADTAQQLHLSNSTVEFHRRRIMQKLGAANAAEMIKKACRLGWDANV